MKKRKNAIIPVAILIGAALVISILSERAAQVLSVLAVLSFGAVTLAANIEKPGIRALLFAMAPTLTTACRVLGQTNIAKCASDFLNRMISAVSVKLGIEINFVIGNETAVAVMFWVLFAIAFVGVNRFDSTAMGIHRNSDDQELWNRNFYDKSQAFCKALHQRLESINRETDWNESLFTPIDAEVEVNIKGRRKRRYADLLKCLKKTRRGADVFLVLGDPGAGKSVALRKLCFELLGEAKKTQKIPLYINLKKWDKEWNVDNRPGQNDLVEFIREIVSENGDIFTDEFIQCYFDAMLRDGRWYFIFDSFDEMPCLTGSGNCQELIDHLSELLYQFLTGANQNGGVIASRLYRAPSEAIRPTVTLRIQEFSDIKIKTMLNKYLNNADKVMEELFGKREDLVALCRNPFYLTLLINYIRENGIAFPKNQMDLYNSFVSGRLSKCEGKLEKEGLSQKKVRKAAQDLAAYLQSSPIYGLECPVRALCQQKESEARESFYKALRLLEYAKICRIGGADEVVSFVHRRFQEFFFVESIMERQEEIPRDEYTSILYNSGIRDALVLYCEVTSECKAREIAEWCWNIICEKIQYRDNVIQQGGMELVNTLCFMTEAFRNRKNALSRFIANFEDLVVQSLNRESDFVVLLALINSMALFSQACLQQTVLKVFRLKNRWLNDMVVQNCRLIHRLDMEIEVKLCDYFSSMDVRTFLKRFRNTNFSLSVSPSFRYVRLFHALLAVWYIGMGAAAIVLVTYAVVKLLAMQMAGVPIARFWVQQEKTVGPEDVLFGALLGMLFILIMRETEKPKWGLFLFGQSTAMVAITLGMRRMAESSGSTILYIGSLMWAGILLVAQGIPLTHDLCYGIGLLKKKRRELFSKSNIIATGIAAGVLCATILIFGLLAKYGKTIMMVLITIACLLVLWYVLCVARQYVQDWCWVRRQPNIQRITRRDVERNLDKLHIGKWKRVYIDQLLQNKVRLEGDWIDGVRPGEGDDSLERSIAKLDCVNLGFSSLLL